MRAQPAVRAERASRASLNRIAEGSLRVLERINPSHALPDDQRMHIMRAFVGFH